MHPALQVLQPAEGCALSSADDRERIFPFIGNPGQSYVGARTAGLASVAHVLPDPGSLSSCHCSSSGSSSLLVSWFPLCLSGQGYVLTAQSDPAHTPPALGRQTEVQFAPRICLCCGCIISWRSGSSELSGQSQLLVDCTKTCASTRTVCCRWPGGLCFLDRLRNSSLL